MSTKRRSELQEQVRGLFYHGFDNYMAYGFPEDELQPLTCSGRGSDKADVTNIGINDVCGDYALTLIDSLDMLPILGNQTAFETGVRNVIDTVSFNVDSKVQVFEATIRVLGGLLSAHQYASLPELNCTIPWYEGELLVLAHDLGKRLLPAFKTATGIPLPRINLKYGLRGLPPGEATGTCAAGAGSLVLEFALLSRLTNDARFETVATRAFKAVWDRRLELGLVGNTIDAHTGVWTTTYSGIGAGIDSFYEYALKAWVFLGDDYFFGVWNESYHAITEHVLDPDGYLFRNVHVRSGFQITNYIDSLSAYFPGLLVLAGDLELATKTHLIYQSLWTRYKALPERYNFNTMQTEIPWYPLRPEFIESTYFLYRATKDPFYLAVGEQILQDLTSLQTKCGFAVLADVHTHALDNRMESFMLSETLKYLFLLFSDSHPLNSLFSNWVFTTEGHPIFVPDLPPRQSTRQVRFSTTDVCEVPKVPGFFSAVMSRDDLYYAQLRAGLSGTQASLPSYFPPANSTGTSKSIHSQNDIEVLFGSVASSMFNASANIVQIGKELMIKSLLGLKFRFSRGSSLRITKVGSFVLAKDTEVVITDPQYHTFATPGLVGFATVEADVMLEVLDTSTGRQVLRGIAGLHGSALPTSDVNLTVISLLDSDNPQGCTCPALFGSSSSIESSKIALLLLRGGCSFYEKSQNSQRVARLLIVVDFDAQVTTLVRPMLIDEDGTPLPSSDGYPSIVLIQGVSNEELPRTGTLLKVQKQDPTISGLRLLIRDQMVHNVRIIQ